MDPPQTGLQEQLVPHVADPHKPLLHHWLPVNLTMVKVSFCGKKKKKQKAHTESQPKSASLGNIINLSM